MSFINYLKEQGITSKNEIERLFQEYINLVHSGIEFSKDFNLHELLTKIERSEEVIHLFI